MLARPALSLTLLASLLVAGACASTPSGPALSRLHPGALPTVTMQTLDGRAERLDAAVAGKPALVSLWATWCEACTEELGALARLDARLGPRGVDGARGGAMVVGVAVGEQRATVADFVSRHKIPYAQLVDEEFHFADALGLRKVPATLVIDRAGQVVFTGGALDGAALRALEAAMN